MMNNRILMRIDFQNDFVHPQGALSINAPELIERQQKFADNLFPSYFDKIIDTYDTHFAETYGDTIEAQSFPPHCLFGSKGWQQAAPFKPALGVIKMYKSTTDIWNEAQAYRDLAESWKGKKVYLCGVLSDICVLQAMDGLLKRGAKVVVLEDLCHGKDRQICDILQDEKHHPLVTQGKLTSITSAQFFREVLAEKKKQYYQTALQPSGQAAEPAKLSKMKEKFASGR